MKKPTAPNTTQERLKQLLRYEPETGLFIRLVATARTVDVGSVAGSNNRNGYVQIRVDGKLYQAHRLAWLYVYGEWPSDQIDHINGIKNDNRIANLRNVTQQVNTHNQRHAPIHNTSGYLGVSWNERLMAWRARITLNRKPIHLGMFKTPEQAHEAYLQAKRRFHAEGCTI